MSKKNCKDCTYYFPVRDLYVSCSATDRVHPVGWERKVVCKYFIPKKENKDNKAIQ